MGTNRSQNRKLVRDSVRKLAYDFPKRNLSTPQVTVVSLSYDKLMIIVGYFVNRAPGMSRSPDPGRCPARVRRGGSAERRSVGVRVQVRAGESESGCGSGVVHGSAERLVGEVAVASVGVADAPHRVSAQDGRVDEQRR